MCIYIYISDVVYDKTFALVQTVESDGRTTLTTVPNRWTTKNFYPVDQHSSKYGNDMVHWPTPKGPEDKKFWEIAISKPEKATDLSKCQQFRCKIKANKVKSYSTVSYQLW